MRLRPNPKALAEFPKIAARVWEAGQGDAQVRVKRINTELERVRAIKKKLLERYLEEKIAEDDYQQMNADYGRQIGNLERQLRELSSIGASTDAFVRFAEMHLSDMAALWQKANDDQRRRVQTTLFREGLRYFSETRSLNPDNNVLFSVLEKINPENLRLASPTGFEPVLPP